MNNLEKLIKILKDNKDTNPSDIKNFENFIEDNKELIEIQKMLLKSLKTKIPYKRLIKYRKEQDDILKNNGIKIKDSSRDLIYKLPEYSNITSNNKS